MKHECLRCGGSMTEGYTLDVSHAAKHQSQWVEGKPERSFWTGLKTQDRKVLNVTTWRCTKCGWLDSYAE